LKGSGACHAARLSFATRNISAFKATAGNLGDSSCLAGCDTESYSAALACTSADSAVNNGNGWTALNAGFGLALIKNLFIPDSITPLRLDLFQKVLNEESKPLRKPGLVSIQFTARA